MEIKNETSKLAYVNALAVLITYFSLCLCPSLPVSLSLSFFLSLCLTMSMLPPSLSLPLSLPPPSLSPTFLSLFLSSLSTSLCLSLPLSLSTSLSLCLSLFIPLCLYVSLSPSVCVCVCVCVCVSSSRPLWDPREHCERSGDRRELWLPGHSGVPVFTGIQADRLLGEDLSPGQPVVRTTSCVHT